MGINRRDFIKLFGLGGVGFSLNPQIEFPEIQQPLNDDFDTTLNYTLIDIGTIKKYDCCANFTNCLTLDITFWGNNISEILHCMVASERYFSLTGLMKLNTSIVRVYFFKTRIIGLAHIPFKLPSIDIRAYLDDKKPLNQSIGYMVVETDTRPPIKEFDGISHMINVK